MSSKHALSVGALCGVAISLLAGSALAVPSVKIFNLGTVKATDFHIVFSGPVSKNKISASNLNTVGYNNNMNNELNFTGGQGVNPNQSTTLNNAMIGTAAQAGTDVHIVSWNWTPTAGANPVTVTPYVQFTDPNTGVTSNYSLNGVGNLVAPTGAVTTFEVIGIPEPANWVLMITGFGLAGAMLRRSPRTAT